MHRVTPNWTWTLNSQKHPMWTKYLPLTSKFWSISLYMLYDQRFPRYRTFYNFPLNTVLNIPKRKKKIAKIWNFTILYAILVDTLPRSMHEFLGANPLCIFRQCHKKVLLQKKKKWQKSKIWNFTNLYTTLIENLPRSMHEFLGVIMLWNFEEMSFEVFSPIWSHVNENETKIVKIKNAKFKKK